MAAPEERRKALEDILEQRVLVLDGAMGTMLRQQRLTAEDFGGAALEGCNENLVRTRPDVVLGIHRAYLEAGSDVVETNSFGGAKLVLAEYGLADNAYELNFTVAKLARQAAEEFSTSIEAMGAMLAGLGAAQFYDMVLSPDSATTPPCGGEDSSQRN